MARASVLTLLAAAALLSGCSSWGGFRRAETASRDDRYCQGRATCTPDCASPRERDRCERGIGVPPEVVRREEDRVIKQGRK